ncbi:hypothetical protein CHS0354_017017 [Potamilus streckersoni]|uniref:Sushi domain-containing protein n=1 Tax=Potamilus streckersoni TaxID=2493646 RepID=A0AAE0SZC3_9BIVA|nr:hypothetical protein CHS0354_017017 [Potamilus streckersoni]
MPTLIQKTLVLATFTVQFVTVIETSVVCPTNFPGGAWNNCQNKENETCTYSCLSGFHRNPEIQNVTCLPDGAWNQNTEKLCRRKCEMGITNGYLNSICTLDIGESCSFACELAYKPISGMSTVTCQENGEWAPEEPCEDILCPTTFQNGKVNETLCDRRIYSECPFICNQRFYPNPEETKIFCGINGIWMNLDKPPCLERKGLCVNFFEHGKWVDDCQFKENESCAFECDGGFDKNPNITRNITCTSSAEWNIDLSLLCIENDRGLIATVHAGFSTKHLYTVPTTQDGTPTLDYIRSLLLPFHVQFLSVDGDYILKQAYVYDHFTKTIYKNANFSIGLSGLNTWTTLHMGTSHDYVKLAVDWISHNIYWTDPQYKWIMVQTLLGNDTSLYRVLIHDNLEGPHALALDPIEALLFWSDIGTFNKIEVSSLSGRNRKSLISSNLHHPYSLALDYVARRIYFIDTDSGTVQTVTYDGKDRKVVLRKINSYLFDIAVYKDYLYVTNVIDHRLYFFNKTNGKEVHKSLYGEDYSYYGITVFHPDAHPSNATAHCINHGCEQICVTEKDGGTCLCKDGYTLNQDMKTCSLNNEYFHRGLMYSNATSICIVDIRIVTDFVFSPKCVLKSNGTKFMVLDTDQRQIILANNTAIYAASVDNPSLHQLTKQSGEISGMAWDGYDRNLYWTEKNTGSIWRLSEGSQTAHIFMTGLNKPRDVLVLPHERLIYWISDRNGSTIESSKLDGSSHNMVLNSEDLLYPRSLSYDPYAKRIYFIDNLRAEHNYVASCKLDGSSRYYFLSTDKILDKLEIYRGHLLVTAKDVSGTLLESYSIDLRTRTTSGVFSEAGNISAIKVFDETFRQNETGPCFTLNGDCEHICIANGKSRICECTFGFNLAANGKTCMSDPVKDNFILFIDNTNNGIYQMSLTDQSIHGIISKTTSSSLFGVTYTPFHDLVIWGTNEPEISIMHLNGTGKKLLPAATSEGRFYFINRFAVDYSTGNIYYTAVYDISSSINVILPNGKHRVLVTGLDYPYGLVVYPSKGLMFYTDSGIESHLGQASMDGSQSTVLLDLTNDWPAELAIDYINDYLYWINYMDDSIQFCKLDGTNYSKLTRFHDIIPNGLALYQDLLFISMTGHSHMIKLKISNPNETILFATPGEIGSIGDISLYSSTVQNRNAFCSSGNGGCSTFCFPTPGGRICGCEDGVELKKGSDKECSNMGICDSAIPNGSLPINCNLDIGSTCSYYCDDYFVKNRNISSIQCNENGQWNADVRLLCTKANVICSNKFPGGGWDNCQNRENETCSYSCFPEFHRNPNIQNATCGSDGAWNQNTEKLCRRKCDLEITNGVLSSSCTLTIGEMCNFECEHGYKVTSGVSTVTCQENSLWAPEEPCEAILCPATIPNGTINETVCDRRIYSECPFICNQGFDPNPKNKKVFCDMDGKWNPIDTPYCLERKGLCVNVFEHGKWADDCHFNADETCAFECDGGFDKNPNITRNITCTASAKWNIDLNLLCKENDKGLIVTLFHGYDQKDLYTVPIDSEGVPSLNYIRSLSFPTDVQFYSVEGDYKLQQAYVYDRYTKAIYKDSNFSIGLSGENEWTTLHIGLSQDYVKLAVDWISHNIYWTDPQYKWIMVQTLLGNDTSLYRVLIHDNLEGPHALALDPIEALLFWSDVGSFTKIEVSSLSGLNRRSLVYSNLIYPYSMAADHSSRHLYFADANRGTVETVTYDGKDRKVLIRKAYSYFLDIAVFKDFVYVIDLYAKLYFFNNTNGTELHQSLFSAGARYLGVTVYHPDAQTTSITAHCVNYGCEQICATEVDGATCLCKDGYTLNQDRKTCSLQKEFFHRGLMYSNETSVCIVDIRVVTNFSFYPNCVLKINGTRYMALDTDVRVIILANETAIYWARVDNPELRRLTEPSGNISGLAWDGYDRNLYWTEYTTGMIWRLSRETGTAQIFKEGLNKPRDILILPHERLVYWISDGNVTTIESSRVDGSNHQVVLTSNDLFDIKSLSYEPYKKRIYFLRKLPEGRDYVVYCNLDGSGLNFFFSVDKRLEKLEIYRGHLLLTAADAQGTFIMSYSVDSRQLTTSGIFPGAGKISAIKVFDEHFRQNETGPCFAMNGECEQICISNGKSRICGCTFGFKLSVNGKTCTSDPIKDNFMLASDTTHRNIYQINLADQSIQGIKIQGTVSWTGLTYSPVNDQVIWGTDESEISIMHLNGTGTKMVPISLSGGSYVVPIRFAVDYSTGNIYYTADSLRFYIQRESYIGVLTPDGKHRVLISGLENPYGLVVYPSKGLLFYSVSGFISLLGQANMDGSQSVVLLDMQNGWPTELTVDYKSDYLYWVNSWDDSIGFCRLDGSNHSTLAMSPNIILHGIAFYQDYLFISTVGHSNGNLIKLKISNPNVTTEFASYAELGTIRFIGIYSSTAQNKNQFCSLDNGGCSTFCFPIPGGGICGCEDGVDLKEGSKTVCSNVPYCPEISKKIIVSTDCPRLNGSNCTFTCIQGYKAKAGVDKVLCNGEMYIPEDPCEEIKCPGTLANGKWVNCNFSIGMSCNYTCNYGYTLNDAVTEAECQINGNWKLANTDTLCKPITCPMQFNQGRIVSTCAGMLGQRCDYECTGYGYKKNESISRIECMESGTWNKDTNSLCLQITCPKDIPNGAILQYSNGQVCSTAVGTRCGFKCNTGFAKARTVDSLHCLLDGWAEDLQTLCTVPRCPEKTSLFSVYINCQRLNGSKCSFTCKQGYKARPGVDKVLCNGDMYTPEDPCETITCPRQFNQGSVSRTCAGMLGQQCDYECTGYGYKKNANIPTIKCMESGMWNWDTDSLCLQITCPTQIPNGYLVKGSSGRVCSTSVGTRCDFECNSGFLKDATVKSLYCLFDGWAQDIHTLCTVPRGASPEHQSDVHPGAIAAGVIISVSIIIIIILVLVRRKCLNSNFALKRMEEQVISEPDIQMNTSFGPDGDWQNVEYDNYHIDTDSPSKQEGQTELAPEYNIVGNSTKYDNSTAVPRPRAKEDLLNKTP